MRACVLCTFVLCFIGFAGSVYAGSVPTYDTQRYCREVASFGGPLSYSTLEYCLGDEQQSRDAIAAMPQVDPEIMQQCDRIARFGGAGSYATLEYCIRDETAAKERLGY